jgi:cytochrome b561
VRIQQFPLLSRILHWTMAALVIAMLFIGIGMIGSLADYHRLVAIHKPLGILILVMVTIRLVNRLLNPPPELPESVPAFDRIAIHTSVTILYALMFALPLVGWAMLSAADYPVLLFGSLSLPPIVPHNPELYTILRTTHSLLAFLLFGIFVAHFSRAMMRAFLIRDGVFESMASIRRWPRGDRPESAKHTEEGSRKAV